MDALGWLQIASQIPNLVTSVEGLFQTPNSGSQKRAAVVSAIAPLVSAPELAMAMPQLETWMAALVSLYKLTGFFQSSGSTPSTAATAVSITPQTASEGGS